jgi:hypothetical protein
MKPLEYYVGMACTRDENAFAERLVEVDMDAAAALYQALGAHLQDKDIRENYNELDMEKALN